MVIVNQVTGIFFGLPDCFAFIKLNRIYGSGMVFEGLRDYFCVQIYDLVHVKKSQQLINGCD